MNKLKLFGLGLFASLAYSLLISNAAFADVTKLNPYSWDPGLYATTARYDDGAHAWGQRKTGGAWGTGSVNYQSGATDNYRAGSSGSMSVVLEGTYCPGGVCQYGSGSGYKGLVQFWNDPNNYIAFGLIHDPGVSPSGNTLMIEGAGAGRPIGGYWAGGGISGVSHRFTVTWNATSISVTIDNNVTLGPYPVAENNPSVSFLAAGRNTGDISDTTFAGITFSTGSVTADPVTIPSGSPYFTYSANMNEAGSGTGYSSYINAHDTSNNAISVGIQTDSSSPESNGQPYYIWELVQSGDFTYNYLNPASSNTSLPVTLKWWSGDQTAVFYEGSTAIADISVNLVPRLFFQIEGNARLDGDSVSDSFSNTQIAAGNTCPTYCGLNGTFNTSSFNFYGLSAAQQSCSSTSNGFSNEGCNFTVSGTVSGLPAGGTWDTNEVAGIGMIAQYWNGQ